MKTAKNSEGVWTEVVSGMLDAGYLVKENQCYQHHYKRNVLKTPAVRRKYQAVRDHLTNETLTMVPPWTPESRVAAQEAFQAVLTHTSKGTKVFWYSAANEMANRDFRADKQYLDNECRRQTSAKEHDVPKENQGVPYTDEDVNHLVTIYKNMTSVCDRSWWPKITTQYNETANPRRSEFGLHVKLLHVDPLGLNYVVNWNSDHMALVEEYWPVYKTSWKDYEEIVPFTNYVILRKTLSHIKSTLHSKNILNIHQVLCEALMRKQESSREDWVKSFSEITDITF